MQMTVPASRKATVGSVQNVEQDSYFVVRTNVYGTRANRFYRNCPAKIKYSEFCDKLGISNPADAVVLLYILMADTDISRTAADLQDTIDIFFNNYEKFAQASYNYRDAFRSFSAYVRRAAVQRPIQLLAASLKADSMKLVTNNFYNKTAQLISQVQRKSTASTCPLEKAYIEHDRVLEFKYTTPGGTVQTFSAFESSFIRPKYNIT